VTHQAPLPSPHAHIVDLKAPKKPCSECPWRLDVETGVWPIEKFIELARTAYDMSDHIFSCHKSADEAPTACAGFLERGGDHNKTVRLAYIFGKLKLADRSGGYNLYANYREMAIANGVDPEHPALIHCRDD
jgi:hypothetical protein